MRVKEAPKRKDEGEEDAKDSEEDAEEVDDMEGEEGEATEKTESKKKRHKSEDENKKDNAAGGDWELPSMFRAFRGLVEALLDTLSQATGGANFVDEIKEVVSNAETGTINRSIGMIQSHRSGACQATISVVKTGMDEIASQSFQSSSLHQRDGGSCRKGAKQRNGQGERLPWQCTTEWGRSCDQFSATWLSLPFRFAIPSCAQLAETPTDECSDSVLGSRRADCHEGDQCRGPECTLFLQLCTHT